MSPEKLLLKNGVVVMMDSERRIIRDGYVLVEGDRIADVGRMGELREKADMVLDVRGGFIMPGLICGHTHLYGIALRGCMLNIRPPTDFLENLQRIWWPLDEVMENEDAYATALAASMEFALNGTTTFADTYSAPPRPEYSLDRIADGVNEVGIRGIISFEATERRSVEEGRRGLDENIRFLRAGGRGRVRGMVSLHASFTISDDLIGRGVEISNHYSAPITIHVAEGPNDQYHNLERFGRRTVERLEERGLLGPKTVLAHCVHLNMREIGLLRETGTHVAHNPMSNMLNAVGVMMLPEMLSLGVNVCLGNDGYVFDMFENMRCCYLLHRVDRRDPSVINPQTVVEMATINAARAYGLHELGSLEVGKKADLIIVKPEVYATPASGSVYGYIVNGLRGGDVETVIVGGEVVVQNRRLTRLDKSVAEERVRRTIGRLWERLGESPPEAVEPLRLVS
ncbi:MAG: amidohydrolase [Nitrososphaerota archaeon]